MNYRKKENGQVIIIIALLLIAIFGVAAVVVDGTRLYAARRTTQNGADNSALAAALALCLGADPNAAALDSAGDNGFNNDGATNTVEINHPPLSGPKAGDDEFIEVIITSSVDGAFSQVIYPGLLEASARAVGHCSGAGGPPGGNNGIIVLDSDNSCAFNATGNGSITVNGGGIQVDSNNFTSAACATGNAQVNAATSISIVGGVRTTGNADFDPTPTTGAPALGDPLSGLAAPLKPGGSCTSFSIGSNNSATIDPGLYCSISASGNAILTLNPGIYYVDGGNFSVSGNASLTANEVMIYMEDGDFSISGNGNFDISAPASGDYQGMMLFMAQANVSTISITGNGMVSTTGTIYGALSTGNLTGNGANTVLNAQLIVNTLNVTGNGELALNYDPDQIYGGGNKPVVSLEE
ncbi:MAG: pilus assembly protein TadG-related protein [Chloroflexi bacterium]|nr:pilus assembly protein TadG-related protein [Chloroflexota bacterium]